ncbi:FtsX-like permease family protein [Amaricoccus sp.]|uniref:FtsX-like permease family protein n=1 Tax=Amaricoccus sp. TaxID=1872485 RepID=UPI001B6ED2FB|nr:FtsX-like permease family protein [Amaricoccus sp.]MBP7242786.1 ABC transporter permease [Amaricoccus sp.]
MRAAVVLGALVSHWRRHPVELATLLVGLALATALWAGVQALNAEARESYARAAALLGADRLARVEALGGGRFPVGDYVALRRAGWPVSPVLEGDLPVGPAGLRVIGVEPLTLPAEADGYGVAPGGERVAAFLSPPHLGLVAAETLPGLAGVAGLPPLAAVGGLPPLAAVGGLPPDTLVVDIARAERLLGVEGELTRLTLPAEAAGRALPAGLAGRLTIVRPEAADDLARLTDSFHLNLTAFGLLSFLVGLLIVYGAIGLAFEQRKPMLRTLRACGVSARLMSLLLLGELMALALVGGAVGVAGGYALAAALLPDVAASLRGLYGARLPGTLGLDPAWWAAGLGMSLGGALAAGAASLWRAARLPALAVAQPQAWLAGRRRTIRAQAALGAVVALAALAAFGIEGGLAGGLALLGGVVLAPALVAPALVAAALALAARRARGALAQWVWADMRQQTGPLALALMALLIALAVNVGVGTMVGSFRETFLGWLDRRLAAEAYVTARDPAEAEAVARWLDGRPEVVARLPILRVGARVAGWPVEIYGAADHATYRDGWPLLASAPGAWDRVAAGEGVLVSEQFGRRGGLGLGDALDVPTPAGPWRLEVVGIYADYGNPEGQVMVGGAALAARWPGLETRRFALRLDPAAAAGLAADLRAAFGFGPEAAIDQAALKAASTRVFERTFAVTVALNALTLAVAGVALLTSLLTLSGLRLAQLAPVWAVGLTRRRLAALETAKTVGLAALTAVAALPLGLAVAWTLTAVVNVEAFGWRLPVLMFPRQWAAMFGLALVTAFAAALWPALRLARIAPADLMRSFSNER